MTSKMLRLSPVACTLALLSGAAGAATDLDVRVAAGYDSNPFMLNDVVGVRDSAFADLEAQFDASRDSDGGTLGFDAGAWTRLHPSENDADATRLFARLYGHTPKKRPGSAFDWAARVRASDSTYVSRFTGQTATAGGVSIGDRYDSVAVDLRGGWRLPTTGGQWSVEGGVEARDYREDYVALGLARLDYSQIQLEPGYERKQGAHEFRLRLPLALRRYRDRRVEDAFGNPVAGTDLEYTYYGVEAGYGYALAKGQSLEAAGGYEVRADNGVGYRDRKRWNAGVEWSVRPAPKERLSAGFEWSSRTFDRPVTGDPTVVDETPEKDGYTLSARYARPLPVEIRDVSLFATAQWEDFENSNDVRFSYDRLEVLAGLRKEF